MEDWPRFATGISFRKSYSHLFSQYLSEGIPGSITSLALTVYGISTMIGTVGTGFLGRRFRMKNVLASVYALRILIAVMFIFLPKSILFAFIPAAFAES